MEYLQETVRLLYSELLQQCARSLPVDRGISYSLRQIGNYSYWYMELVIGNRKRQTSLGKDTRELRDLIEKQKSLAVISSADLNKRKRLVAMLAKGGAVVPGSIESRVLEVLERAGVFAAGGVLVGSHAFAVYGNMLGARWDSAAMRTQDMDMAGSNHIPVAVSRNIQPLGKALLDAGLGFFEVPALDRKAPSTTYSVRGREFHVDVLTPLHGPDNSAPVFVRPLRAYAHPVRFLDFLLSDTVHAVVVARHGIVVNVPDPARFALHKLVLSERRGVRDQLKSEKDRMQAQQVLEILTEERPGDVMLAGDAVRDMPKKFQQQLMMGTDRLPRSTRSAVLDLVQ